MLRETADVIRVRVNRLLRIIPQLHVVRHALSQSCDAVLPGCHRGILSEVKECFTQNATRLSPCQNMWSRRTTFAAGTTPRTWTFASTWKHAATWNIQATWKFRTNGLRSFLTHSLKRRLSPREAVKFNDHDNRVAAVHLPICKRAVGHSAFIAWLSFVSEQYFLTSSGFRNPGKSSGHRIPQRP